MSAVPVVAENFHDFRRWLHDQHHDPRGYRYALPGGLEGYRGEVVVLSRVRDGVGGALREARVTYDGRCHPLWPTT